MCVTDIWRFIDKKLKKPEKKPFPQILLDNDSEYYFNIAPFKIFSGVNHLTHNNRLQCLRVTLNKSALATIVSLKLLFADGLGSTYSF